MAIENSYPNAKDLVPNDYVVLGLATCFLKQDGEINQIEVIEPIPSAALEAIFQGIPTSYHLACSMTLGLILDNAENLQKPSEFPPEAEFSSEFTQRLFAAARTYKSQKSAQNLIPLGTSYREFQYSTERKRILNAKRNISKSDNVKQHSHTNKQL